jgi:hypothetical protein
MPTSSSAGLPGVYSPHRGVSARRRRGSVAGSEAVIDRPWRRRACRQWFRFGTRPTNSRSFDQARTTASTRCARMMRPDVHQDRGQVRTHGNNEAMPTISRSGLVTRKAQVMVAEALADTRVVTINGARQSGKSTLAEVVAATQNPTLLAVWRPPARTSHRHSLAGSTVQRLSRS